MPSPTFPSPPLPKSGQLRAYWRAPSSPTALAWSIARAAEAHAGPVLVIARDNQSAHQIEADLHALLGDASTLPVVPFPDWETLPYDQFSPHPEIISQRLAALHRLPGLTRGVVIVPVQTLLQQLAPLSYIVGGSFDLTVGQRLDLDAEKRRLESAGYRNVPQVMDPGDFAVRGGLLDVFPMGADTPLRIELLDEDIDSIRAFDPESQRSLDKVDAVKMLPGREVPMDDASVERVLACLRERFDVDTRRSALYQDLKSGIAPSGVEYYLPMFFSKTATLFDYLDTRVLPLIATGVSMPPMPSGCRRKTATSSAATMWNARCCRPMSCTSHRMPCASGSTSWRASKCGRPTIRVSTRPRRWATSRCRRYRSPPRMRPPGRPWPRSWATTRAGCW